MKSCLRIHFTFGLIPIIVWLLCIPVPSWAAPSDYGAQAGIQYHIVDVNDDMDPLEAHFTDRQIALLERLNRVDRQNLKKLDRIVVPNDWSLPTRAYSPFPPYYRELSSYPRFLIVHQPYQVFAAYENGQLTGWGPVSSGREEDPTPSGLFHLNWRSRGHHSTVNPDWYMPWYFNFENKRGLALHAYNLPGYPASHACIRLLTRDAQWLFDWGEEWTAGGSGKVIEQGTPVLIVGEYNFDAPPPWLDPANPHPAIGDLTGQKISYLVE